LKISKGEFILGGVVGKSSRRVYPWRHAYVFPQGEFILGVF